MTLIVPCFDSIYMVFLISALAKIDATKPIFLDSGSPRGGGGECSCVRGRGLLSLHCSYTKIQVKTLFSLSLTVICAELCCQTT